MSTHQQRERALSSLRHLARDFHLLASDPDADVNELNYAEELVGKATIAALRVGVSPYHVDAALCGKGHPK